MLEETCPLGTATFSFESEIQIEAVFSRVLIDDQDLLELSEAEKKAAKKLASELSRCALQEALEDLFPVAYQAEFIEQFEEHTSNRLLKSLLLEITELEALKVWEDKKSEPVFLSEVDEQMAQLMGFTAFGSTAKKGKRRRNAQLESKESPERSEEGNDNDEETTDLQEENTDTVSIKLSEFNSDEEGGKKSPILKNLNKSWQRYWSSLGQWISWSSWLKIYGEHMDATSRESTAQLLLETDTSELLESDKLWLDGLVPIAQPTDANWEEIWQQHFNSCAERSCTNFEQARFPKSNNKYTSKQQRMIKRARRRLKERGFLFGDSKIATAGPLPPLLSCAMNLKPATEEEEEILHFEKRRKLSSEAPDPTESAHSSTEVRFAFDPKKDGHLVAKNMLKYGDIDLRKYWFQRYRLFSKINAGILLDREGWFSVTPERIAAQISRRCQKANLIVDGFCGAGGNSIQFAKSGANVIAIDMDPVKLLCARRNAQIYGVLDKIQFVCANFFHVSAGLKADAVFLSPPWGGPQYLQNDVFDLQNHLTPNGFDIFDAAKTISPNIAFFVPRHTSVKQLLSLAGPGGKVELEQNCLNHKVKSITAYYGNLVSRPSV